MKTLLENTVGIGRVQENKIISHYLTLRTKTAAEYYFEAETREDLINAYKCTKENNIPFFILGGGSNLAITKDTISGLVVRNLYRKKEVLSENSESVDILFSSGYSIARVVSESTNEGWEGFEYHMGLPGTVGGAIYMNSKWTNPVYYIGDSLIYANLIDSEGSIKKVNKEYFKFAYDYSILHETKEIVLEAVFNLKKSDPEMLKNRAKESLKYRHATQPHGVATGGCFFQNVDGKSAGQMIDQAGLKNKKIGSYIVSDKHANFIINTGEGDPKDLLALINLVKQEVKAKFGVDLKEEVIII